MRLPHTIAPEYAPIASDRFAAAISRETTTGCRVGLLGLADDTGVAMNHGRTGAREGPHAFRNALARYGVARPMDAWATPGEPFPKVFDAGDIVPGKSLEETHERVSAAVEAIVGMGMLPVGIGGGHDLTFALVRGAGRKGQEPPSLRSGLYVDAHLDVRAEAGSGMPFRALVERCGVERLTVVGVEPLVNSREHFDWFTAHGGRLATADERPADLMRGVDFVSVDLDAIDAAHAPGVSALNPNGLTPDRVAAIAQAAGQSPTIACFDIMELNPAHDHDGRTARLAVYLFLTFLRGLSERTR